MSGKNRDKAIELVSQMTVEEKASLCSGLDCWHTKPIERLGVPSVMVSDGPHGLRKQLESQDNLGIGDSVPATCFPTASLTACSFDPELAGRIGRAMGEECLQEQVSVILGPGVNMKRSPLCGRNFEYYSEDPVLAGKMAAGMIRGVQSTGVGTSLKHFAANNQECRRMSVSAVIDDRALHELYLKAFEIAVKEANPRTVMCSYNRINGTYSSENEELLNTVLRKKWGYEGLVVSDWGAVHLRPQGVHAGLDLEMPGSHGVNDRKIVRAVKAGGDELVPREVSDSDDRLKAGGQMTGNMILSEADLDKAAQRVVELALDGQDALQPNFRYDAKAHHALAVEAAEKSMVLLKNEEELLPLLPSEYGEEGVQSLLVCGAFAESPRYQGAGSSKIHPLRISSPLAELRAAGLRFEYSCEEAETLRLAAESDTCVIFAGLTEAYESEGFDRKSMAIPEDQIRLIEEVGKVCSRVAVVLMGGSPMELPWYDLPSVKAVLLSYLGGEGVGEAVARLLTGVSCPCGKLAETWPYRIEDTPCYDNFPGDRLNVIYKESIYIGYRYYDTAGIPVRFLFGDGLSYTTFAYSNLRLERTKSGARDITSTRDGQQTQSEKAEGSGVCATFRVKNTGKRTGREISMAFVSRKAGTFLPAHQLGAFCVTELAPGEEKEVSLFIEERELGYYEPKIGDYVTEPGEVSVSVGGSLRECSEGAACVAGVEIEESTGPVRDETSPYFLAPGARIGDIPDAEFEKLLGRSLPEPAAPAKRPFTLENCLDDTKSVALGRMILWAAEKFISKMSKAEENQEGMMLAAMREMPFFALQASSDGMISEKQMNAIVALLNGKPFSAIGCLFKKTV